MERGSGGDVQGAGGDRLVKGPIEERGEGRNETVSGMSNGDPEGSVSDYGVGVYILWGGDGIQMGKLMLVSSLRNKNNLTSELSQSGQSVQTCAE